MLRCLKKEKLRGTLLSNLAQRGSPISQKVLFNPISLSMVVFISTEICENSREKQRNSEIIDLPNFQSLVNFQSQARVFEAEILLSCKENTTVLTTTTIASYNDRVFTFQWEHFRVLKLWF